MTSVVESMLRAKSGSSGSNASAVLFFRNRIMDCLTSFERTHMRRNFIVVLRGLFDMEATATIADVEAEIAIQAAVAATSFGRVG